MFIINGFQKLTMKYKYLPQMSHYTQRKAHDLRHYNCL